MESSYRAILSIKTWLIAHSSPSQTLNSLGWVGVKDYFNSPGTLVHANIPLWKLIVMDSKAISTQPRVSKDILPQITEVH